MAFAQCLRTARETTGARGSTSGVGAGCWTWSLLNPGGVVWRSDVGRRVVRRASDLPRVEDARDHLRCLANTRLSQYNDSWDFQLLLLGKLSSALCLSHRTGKLSACRWKGGVKSIIEHELGKRAVCEAVDSTSDSLVAYRSILHIRQEGRRRNL